MAKKKTFKPAVVPLLSNTRLKSLEEESELAENIIDTVREPLLVLDKDLRVVKANRSFYNLFRVNSDETIGKLVYDLGNHQWDIPGLRVLLETILPEKTKFDNYEVEHDFSVIGKHIMLLNARQIARVLGQEKIILLAIEDITERKFAEKALLISEISYRRLFESAKDGILILDAVSGKIVDVNPFLIDLLGYSHEKFVEKEIWEIGFFKDIVANKDKFLELQEKEYVRYDDLPLETADGHRIHVEFVSNVYLVGSLKVIQCNIRDITQREHTESELRKYRAHLEELVRDRTADLKDVNEELSKEIEREKEFEIILQGALEKERELNEMKSRFISTTSHEFRTPLTAIYSSAEMLQRYADKWGNEKKKEHWDRIMESVTYLTKLLDDILTISRSEKDSIWYNPAQLNLRMFVERCMRESESLITGKHKLLFKYNSNQNDFYLDAKLMKFIFNNLLSNAIKYSPDGGTIDLEISSTMEDLIIKVKDEGIGIPTNEIGKIFESFYRTRNAQDISGTGLGLAIVKRAVDLHCGRITVTSSLRKGTTFEVKIPNRSSATLLSGIN